ncbi:MAG TPA: alpha/beta fold hydrolase [Cytophagaceae bacterium]|nr:alpha/beta fold hydrolase [Cytophagaceae bacterium]
MKRKLKITGIIFLSFFGIGVIAFLFGPKPKAPKLEKLNFDLTNDLSILEKQIDESESSAPGIRRGCEAKIVWADTVKKGKTKIAFLYIHGFGASEKEADPIHKNLAQKYRANLYLSRLAGHGIDLGDSTMAKITADDFVYSIENALAITKQLGDEVIVISNSFGGALSLWQASVHPEIKALVLYSPCIQTANESASMFAKPWGLKLIEAMTGSDVFDYKPYNDEYAKFWTTHYNLNGLAAFQTFLLHTMDKETFEKIKCPIFVGYWYKNENVKDTVASVTAMLTMFNQIGSTYKQQFAFPNVANHEIATAILSKDIEAVQIQSEKFLTSIIQE